MNLNGIPEDELFEMNTECIKIMTGKSDIKPCPTVFDCIIQINDEITKRLNTYM